MGHSFVSFGIWIMQYQQNFMPASGSTGEGSGRQKPKTNIMIPTIRIDRPKTETPKGTYKSVNRKAPNGARIPPLAMRPLYI